jgi:hypothetical protein
MTAQPRSWQYPALLLCLALAGCGKSPPSDTPAGTGAAPGYDTGSVPEAPAPASAVGSTASPPASAPK